MVVKPRGYTCFCFIEIFMVNLTIGLSEAVYLAIIEAVLIEKKVAIDFSELSL